MKPKDGGVEFTPAKPFTGQTPKLGYIITDDSGEKATSTVEVTVTPVTPTAVDDRSRTTPDTPVVIPVLDNDIPGNPKVPSNPTTVVIIDPATKQPEKAVIIPGEGSYIVDPSGDISFTPAPGFDGSGTPLRYQVLDANGTMAAATLTVGDILPITGFGMV